MLSTSTPLVRETRSRASFMASYSIRARKKTLVLLDYHNLHGANNSFPALSSNLL